MKRRLFIKQVSIVTTGVLAFSGIDTYANESKQKSVVIDLLPVSGTSSKIKLKGNIVDAITFQPIENCKMVVKTNKNRLFTTTKEIVTTNGDYAILSGFTTAETRMKKIQVEIKAAGYKTYSSFIYLSPDDCNLHSTEWNYNKNFDYNNDLPKSETVGNQTISLFNFQLVKS
jgi:hypothetical protein